MRPSRRNSLWSCPRKRLWPSFGHPGQCADIGLIWIPKDVIERLLNAGRYPQTAKNAQGISYLVVSGREKVVQINQLYCEIARTLPEDFPLRSRVMRPVLVQEEKKTDALFYGAPQLIFTLADMDHERWKENSQFSLTFLSLMAPSLGLGTCWCGQMAC